MDFLLKTDAEDCAIEIVNKDSDFTNKMIQRGTNNELSYVFNFLTPTAEKDKVAYDNNNDYSPIMYLEYAGKKIMFNGDAEVDVLAEYCQTYGDSINVDVLKVGHHGSDNAISEEFVSAIDPEVAVIQCGLGNTYFHPKKEALNALKNYDESIELYRNDYNGDVLLSIGSDGEMSWVLEKNDLANNWKDGNGVSIAFAKDAEEGVNFMDIVNGLFVTLNRKEIVA